MDEDPLPPSGKEVCRRCWRSPIPYLSIIILGIGILGTFATVAIGYYMVYRDTALLGVCFDGEHPGIRRACLLDLTGGVMSILLSIMFLFIELFSAYLNKNDWKMIFLVIKIMLASVTVIVLVAGAVQGSVAYADFCDELSDYHPLSDKKNCKFKSKNTFDSDVDFVIVIALSGVGALFWILVLGIESIRACVWCCNRSMVVHEYQLVPMNEHQPPQQQDHNVM